ncbi:unnamed protein product, partial [Prorocentrum cordatum]
LCWCRRWPWACSRSRSARTSGSRCPRGPRMRRKRWPAAWASTARRWQRVRPRRPPQLLRGRPRCACRPCR